MVYIDKLIIKGLSEFIEKSPYDILVNNWRKYIEKVSKTCPSYFNRRILIDYEGLASIENDMIMLLRESNIIYPEFYLEPKLDSLNMVIVYPDKMNTLVIKADNKNSVIGLLDILVFNFHKLNRTVDWINVLFSRIHNVNIDDKIGAGCYLIEKGNKTTLYENPLGSLIQLDFVTENTDGVLCPSRADADFNYILCELLDIQNLILMGLFPIIKYNIPNTFVNKYINDRQKSIILSNYSRAGGHRFVGRSCGIVYNGKDYVYSMRNCGIESIYDLSVNKVIDPSSAEYDNILRKCRYALGFKYR